MLLNATGLDARTSRSRHARDDSLGRSGLLVSRGSKQWMHLVGLDLVGAAAEIANDLLALVAGDEFGQLALLEQRKRS